jgi:hypothetical protein
MKRSPLALVVALLAVACARPGSDPGSAGEPTDPDSTRVEIYSSAFRALAETEGWFDPVLLDERICPDVADFEAGDPTPCEERFTEAEQAAILEALSDLPNVRFVADAERMRDRIFEARLEGAGLLSVGPIEGDDERVTVGGQSYCGGLCAHWLTLVIQHGPDEWTVTGTTGPVAIS